MFWTYLSLARKVVSRFDSKKNTRNAQPTARKSRPGLLLGILSVLVLIIALILSVLCVYAGHTPGMMNEYALFKLNTSRIGLNIIADLDDSITSLRVKRSAPVILPTVTAVHTTMITLAPRGVVSDLTSGLDHITSEAHSVASVVSSKATAAESAAISKASGAAGALETEAIQVVNKAYRGIIDGLNITDFYTLHISTTCSGLYVYQNGTNVTVADMSPLPHDVHEHVEKCKGHSFANPVNLVRILYWGEVVLTSIALVFSVVGLAKSTRKMAWWNVIAALAAFCTSFLASIIAHGIAIGAAKLTSFVGRHTGISGSKGDKFLALTWTVTALLLVNTLLWTALHFSRKRSDQGAEPSSGSSLAWGGRTMRTRPDRTSGIALGPISRPMPVHDSHGNQMI